MSKTVMITSVQQFSQILTENRIVVTDFYADWCGPCKVIAPYFEQLSGQLSRPKHITFVKIDVDQQKEIASRYQVTAMPTFMIFKAGREVKRIKGADPKALDAAVKQLAIEAGNADASGGSAGPSSSSSTWLGAEVPRSYSDITDEIDTKGLDFANVEGETDSRRAIFGTTKPSTLGNKSAASSSKQDWIESDTDEQIMLYIPFQATLKLHSLHITSLSSDESSTRPRTLKLYTNRATMLGFDEADDIEPTQTIEIKESDWNKETGTAKVDLRFVKFQSVSSIVVFVVDGDGDDDKTRIDRLRLFGESGEKKKMGTLEKIGNEQGE